MKYMSGLLMLMLVLCLQMLLVGCGEEMIKDDVNSISKQEVVESKAIAIIQDNTMVEYTITDVEIDDCIESPEGYITFYVGLDIENKGNKEQFIVYPDLWDSKNNKPIGNMKNVEYSKNMVAVDEKISIKVWYELPKGNEKFILKVGNLFVDVPIELE